jgi:hypothetical protein
MIFFEKEINIRMDSILEKHLKRAFAQTQTAVLPEKPKNTPKRLKSDPILEKHLSKIFLDNEEVAKNIKAAVEVKKKNEEILQAFSNIIETKLNEPIILEQEKEIIENKEEEIVKEDKVEEIIVSEISDVNKNITVPEKEKNLHPTVIDAYKTAIHVPPPTLEPEIFDPVEDPIIQPIEEPIIQPDVDQPKTMQDVYVKSIKDSEVEPRISDEESSDNDFFAFLERNKDHPKLKNFFNTHSESMKKEILKISENFTKEKMLIAAESGGGSGNVNITNTIQDRGKFVGLIGNGVDTEYIVEHNIGTKNSVVCLYDASNDELVFSSATHISDNETKFSFAEPIATDSIRVVIIS